MIRVYSLSFFVVSIMLAILFSLVPQLARAQFSIPTIADNLTIVATPSAPGPHTPVHLSLESTVTKSAVATWTVNGRAVSTNEDTGGIDIQTGALGEKTTITASVDGDNGAQTVTLTLVPTAVDLLLDATSYVPPFFKGRPLASPGTTLRAQALPHFGNTTPVSNDRIMFTWRQGGAVVASGVGKSSVSLAAPPLFGSDTISVEAQSVDGAYAGEASVQLPGIDPNATLYVNNPLTGIEYYDAIQNGAKVPDIETTLIAVPYFTEAQSPNDAQFIYDWKVNGEAVPDGASNASEITINSSNSTGAANLSLTLSSSANFYLHADQSWNISFPGTKSALPGASIPSSSSDVFHTGIQQ